MNTRHFFIPLAIIFSACGFNSKKESEIKIAKDLIKHSIAYHDPNGNWMHFKSTIQSNSSLWKNDGVKEKNTAELFFDNQNGVFKIHSITNEIELKGEMSRDTCYNQILNEITEDIALKYKQTLGCNGINFYKDYYAYLIGLPMKLLDSESIINDTIFERQYNGIKYDVVKVNYQPLDKNPSWYFYFNKKNHSFELCKFTSRKDENKGGEYIIYNQEKNVQGMKLKGQQVWLYNKPTLDTLAVDNLHFKVSNE